MKKLLSAVLSISILFSSVSPSLAQTMPVGRQVVKGVVSGGANAASSTVGKQMVEGLATRNAAAGAASVRNVVAQPRVSVPATGKVPSVVSARVSSSSSVSSGLSAEQISSVSTSVDRAIRKQMAVTGRDISQAVKEGKLEGMAARILNYQNPGVHDSLLRNEFVTVALGGGASKDQIAQALDFYRKDLMASSDAFAKLPQENISGMLQALQNPKHPSYQTVLQSHHALSSAAALGLLGSRADAAALVAFYKKASSSVFKETAAVIAARGLLRQGAYNELTELAALTKAEGSFWKDVAALAQQHNWPVQIAAAEGPAAAASKDLALFLQVGCAANRLNADPSRKATEKWLALGKSAPQPVAKPAPSLAKAARLTAPLQVSLPQVNFAQADLTAGDLSASVQPTVPTQPVQAPAPESSVSFLSKSSHSDNDGVLYSGVPVFAVGKMFKRMAKWLRGKWGSKTAAPAETKAPVEEEPGLHDDSEIHEVFSDLASPEAPASADEVLGTTETSSIPVSEKGFKLTLVDEHGVERILPVNLEISNRFRVKGYNRIAFAAHSNYKHGYVAELRNQEKDPLRMAHFYMRLQTDQVGTLADLVESAGIEKFYLKLESQPNVAYETIQLPVTDFATGKVLPLEVTLPLKNYTKDAKMVLMENDSLGLLKPGASAPKALTGLYVRLPKNQISNFVKILQFSPIPFNVSVHPTQHRADLIMREASLTNVSLGKTMGPVVNNALNMDVSTANSMMFTINYILPGMASLLTPILKKYGEKKLMVLSLAMSSAAGILASAGGFYGFVEGLTLGPVSKGLFITALFLMSGSSILKQLVSNMLIRANRGEVILDQAKEALTKSETEFTAVEKQGFAQMGVRLKEFFTKNFNVSLKDIVLYNLSFVYKNAGTLAFLASPYLINFGLTQLTGHNYGLDYSISFPIYAAYSSLVAWRVWRAKLRDAYSVKNLEQSQKNLQRALETGSKALAQANTALTATQIDDAARMFKDSLDALVFADMKINPGQKKADLYAKEKEAFLAKLQDRLVKEHNLAPQRAQEIVSQIKASIAVQENTLGNMMKMLKAPGVASLATAMTLATVHEFVISSAFASTMKGLISQGELANFLIACSLYIPLILGRLGGNLISRRISADTMYILCSSLSALGTGIMATAGSSVAQTITGAAIASLGVGNFFTQMYDYVMNRYPKQNRELSSILALTMAIGGLGAIPAGYLAEVGNAPALIYAGVALGLSLVLTPGMMVNSSLVKGIKYEAGRLWKGVKKLFKRGNKKNDGTSGPAAEGMNLDDAAPAQ